MMRLRKHLPGFTLIELLVVISIIVLLIAILMPALTAAQEAGRSVQCLSNQRQVVLGMHAYQADSSSYWPMYYFWPDAYHSAHSAKTRHWGGVLWALDYLKDAPTLLICPSFRGASLPSSSNLSNCHYGYNYMNIGTTNRSRGGARLAARHIDIHKPSETYALMDSGRNVITTSGDTKAGFYVVSDDSVTAAGFDPFARHSGRTQINLMWADGHGSAVKVVDLLQPYNDLGSYSTTEENFWDIQ
jgi:prepilin-type N-terminal cleavage/methylation domain-containing protein/prepilin-type processing-associated H-X9-DG protein